MSKRTLEERQFARGYGAALKHVQGLKHQHWPAEALPSIGKLMAQIQNCLAPKKKISAVYELMCADRNNQ